MLEPSDVVSDNDFLDRLSKLGKGRKLPAAELKDLAGDVNRLYQVPFLYTTVRFLVEMGLLRHGEATSILKSLLENCSPLCVSSDHLAFYSLAVKKAEEDGFIDSVLSKSFVDNASRVEHIPYARMMGDFGAFLKDAVALMGSNLKTTTCPERVATETDALTTAGFNMTRNGNVDRAAIDAVNHLRQQLVVFRRCNQNLKSHLNRCAKSLSESALVELGSSQEAIRAAFQARRSKALEVGSCVCRAMVGAILLAYHGLWPVQESGPHETLFTRIIDLGDAKHIRKALQLARSAYPEKCEWMGYSFEEGRLLSSWEKFGISDKAEYFHRDARKTNAMLLVGGFCNLAVQGPKYAVYTLPAWFYSCSAWWCGFFVFISCMEIMAILFLCASKEGCKEGTSAW